MASSANGGANDTTSTIATSVFQNTESSDSIKLFSFPSTTNENLHVDKISTSPLLKTKCRSNSNEIYSNSLQQKGHLEDLWPMECQSLVSSLRKRIADLEEELLIVQQKNRELSSDTGLVGNEKFKILGI